MIRFLYDMAKLIPLLSKLIDLIEQQMRERAASKRLDEKDRAVDSAIAAARGLPDEQDRK
jgi:hypothetical protein